MNKVLFSSNSVEWSTPQKLFDDLNSEFNFTLDLCASEFNHKLDRYYSIDNSCFDHSLTGERIFCNPPYDRKFVPRVLSFVTSKIYMRDVSIAVFLLPARTDVKWFHDFIYNKCEIRFLKGRLRFNDSVNVAPFPSMLCIFRGEL